MKKLSFAFLLILLIISLGATASAQTAAPTAAPTTAGATRYGMVVSSSNIASQVGYDILKKGGNAVDAGVAVALAEAVALPRAGNLGGGGFMIIRMADGRSVAIDYREMAPGKATRDMYLDAQGNVVPNRSTVGYLAVGVPGTVAGMGMAEEKYGALKWQDVVEPARKLAAEGFVVSDAFAASLKNSEKLLSGFPESKRIFLNSGKFYSPGDTFKQPELADTLARIQQNGWREFYEGKTAQFIADDMAKNGGLITLDDLKNYKAVAREPIKGTYRGYEFLTMPPPSSGGIVLAEMLNILEQYDLKSMGANSPDRYYLMTEAMKRAFADRSEFFGDPDFVKIPKGLTSKKYAIEQAKTIDLKKATPSEQVKAGNPAPYESAETTHFSIVDAAGNAVSNTFTINGSYGSGVTVPGAGFLLNNEMDDFASKVGVPNMFGLIQGEKNAVAPAKRPLSSMTPTIVLKGGKVAFVLGSPGGPTIINAVLDTMVNVIDFGMPLDKAVAAPRIHHQWLPDQLRYEEGLPKDVLDALAARGEKLADKPANIGDVEAVGIDPTTGARLGVPDPRSADAKAVGD